MLLEHEWQALWLTLKLASITTLILLVISAPLAWWLARTQTRLKPIIVALIALPLVLPPTVLGFYFLLLLSPDSGLGQLLQWLNLGSLAFSFEGLVLASVIYSLPFVVQPIHNSIQSIGERPFEMAATLRTPPWQQAYLIVWPLAKSGFMTGAVLGFAHTVGEFGIILMIGGNIPNETQVLSVLLYEQVESLNYERAHWLSGLLVVFSLIVLSVVYQLQQSPQQTSVKSRQKGGLTHD